MRRHWQESYIEGKFPLFIYITLNYVLRQIHIFQAMSNFKSALILDKLDRGTIHTCLEANKYYKTLKLLNSSVKNWESICEIIERNETDIIVLGKFTEYTLFKMSLPEYENVVERLITAIAKTRHLLFIYKENLLGNFSYFQSANPPSSVLEVDDKDDYFYYHNENLQTWLHLNDCEANEEDYAFKVRKLIGKINNTLTILPYEKLIDIEIAGQSFIENTSEGLLFRIYIPNDRIWSREFEKFINLFRDYVSNVSKKELKISQSKTDLGVVCSLYSADSTVNEAEMNDMYKDFTAFMDLCSSNPKEAEKMLAKLDLREPEKQRVFSKYVKESQRLALDIKQEKEFKLMSIKHRLENELQEIELTATVLEYVEHSFPRANFQNSIGYGNHIVHNQTININPQIIEKVNGIVSKEINGTINFNREEEALLKLIQKYAKSVSEASELQSSLYELKDDATSKENKRGAWQKIYGFLSKVGEKVGEVGVSLLTKYLEQQLGM